MIKGKRTVEMPLEKVYAVVEMQFAKTFKTSPGKLAGATLKTKRTTAKQAVEVKQEIITLVKNESIVFTTESLVDRVTTGYLFAGDDHATTITLFEKGTGINSPFRTVFYAIVSLPLINLFGKQKLKKRLDGLAQFMEANA